MRQGGRYVVEKPGQKPRRVEWTRTAEEARAERRAARATNAAAKGQGKGPGASKPEGGES